MKQKIIFFIKSNKYIYKVYFTVFSSILKIIGLFIKTNDNLILFNSFGGKKYDDSPKAIYEYMIRSKKYLNFDIYWALNDVDINIPGPAKIIKNDSFKYFIIALKSKYWISNSSIERGLKFKKKATIYINTWHGSALKKMGLDTSGDNFNFNFSMYNYIYAQSDYDINVFSNAYKLPLSIFKKVGLPRNDELTNISEKNIAEIKKKLNLPLNKKIIIYAPTFREYDRDKDGCISKPPIDILKWEKELSKDYIVLFRAHYEVNRILDIKNNGFIYDFSSYPNLNELLKISDILISDYSSIMIDYSILERPIFSYAYDLDKYIEKRGLYIDLKKELPNGVQITETELLNQLKNIDSNVQKERTKKFKNRFVEKCGSASKFIDEIILKNHK